MTRPIKFRAWDKKEKRILIPHSVYLINGSFDTFGNGRYINMQFTGLTDKNGKEIYEGDIVQIYSETTNEKAYKIEIESIMDLPIGLATCEVIGNIYENPELLK